jgi:hypothetical protein
MQLLKRQRGDMADQKERAKNNFEIIISDQAKKSLKKIDSRYHKKIKQKIIALSVDPFSVGKKIRWTLCGVIFTSGLAIPYYLFSYKE